MVGPGLQAGLTAQGEQEPLLKDKGQQVPPRTHHDLQGLLDTITDEVVVDGSLDLHLVEADLQGHNDIRHRQRGPGWDH